MGINVDDEEWRPIPIKPWTGVYEISNHGRVRLVAREVKSRIIDGYPSVTLKYQGKCHTARIHRLIASAFLRPPKDGEMVNHKNAIRTDNSLENLEWTTASGNVQHTYKLGRAPMGLDHYLGKVDPEIAAKMHADGHSLSAIGDKFGASIQAVCQLLKRMKKDGRYKRYTS